MNWSVSAGGVVFFMRLTMRSMGSVMTWRLCVLRKDDTFSRIRLCLGLAVCTSKMLPLGNVFAIG